MSAEVVSFLTLLTCFISIFFMFKYYGKVGLFVYTAIVVIASNLQVLRLTQYSFFENPTALGTVAFSTTFAVDNILTEIYGHRVARRNIWLGFFGYLFFICLMKLTTLHPTVYENQCINLHKEICRLFSPSFTIFISSLISYVVCQFLDVGVFSFLKTVTHGKYFAVRSLIAMAFSSFSDNLIFSIFAWIIFAKNPIDWPTVWS